MRSGSKGDRGQPGSLGCPGTLRIPNAFRREESAWVAGTD